MWGENDCCLWMADAFDAVTGIDLAGPWRRTYSTKDEAEQLMRLLGGWDGVFGQTLGRLKVAECHPRKAGEGMPVLVKWNGEDHGGVFWQGRAYCLSLLGLMPILPRLISRAWSL